MTSRTAILATAVCLMIALLAAAGAASAWPGAVVSQDVTGTPAESPITDVVPAISAPVVVGAVPIRSSEPEAVAAHAEVVPNCLAIPSVGVDMNVITTGLAPDGSMALPESSATAAWYRHGGLPGERGRAALIAAHVSSAVDGEGPFARLARLAPGAEVAIALSDGTVNSFAVARVEHISKQTVDFEAISAGSPGMVVLVTCGGAWDAKAQSYDDNVIVWAVSTQVP
ncbi:class F sortase [Demequina sp. TTPB684]|uniref:class F sortase n=1 Tax=unclassified Demequina TaxID=2620311 RepID=UPI001CF2DD65|nr:MULTISPECIES: class F sortase [unclassified Demequina]MCB2413012.1 class F sortase [Demequina sp. TTPB684]UPU87081.1 class F sortase [Demequina sp. TMPB413]